jgi:hypothetical protein
MACSRSSFLRVLGSTDRALTHCNRTTIRLLKLLKLRVEEKRVGENLC